MWIIENDAILTKDNLAKRNWQGDMRCSFCQEQESISHLFFDCTMAKYTWSMVAMVMGAPNFLLPILDLGDPLDEGGKQISYGRPGGYLLGPVEGQE